MMTPKELYELRDRLQEAIASYENDQIGRFNADECDEPDTTPVEIRMNDLKFLNTLLARELARYPESKAD